MPIERGSKTALFVFAHQDDEAFCATRIERELGWSHEVHCVHLTDGGKGSAAPSVRDHETLAILTELGVPRANIHLLGTRDGVPDGALVEHLGSSLARLEEALEGRAVQRVYCLAYEGGHQDHDASHLVALAFARRRRLLSRTWQIAVYNGWGLPGKLFHVDRPLALAVRRRDRRLSLSEGLRNAFLLARYPSQRKSFFGLLPGHFVARVLQRRESLQAVSPELVGAPPHPGPLLYERLYRFPYSRFERSAAPFIEEHLGRAAGGD